ncbi:low affinity iron permease family protein [Nocardia sp. 2]|uniref:Low affinity iron permease family protein n=1 Tax=Nocardia acididurans TaxID=2802282 RepID=A0ABS1M8F4_9NOCA|nr:low affinity iron permease family protein [Nocardia acididurans]MBL1076917.1 low affinity iron permease family protein [Nocardia acididurans]
METPERGPGRRAGALSVFDRFASKASEWASRAGFFVFCVVLVVIWAPTILVLPSVDTWQLVINTATTIITFLLVALLQNTQSRSDAAIQEKLNAVAGALAAFMGELSAEYPELERHRSELADAVGLERREGSRHR